MILEFRTKINQFFRSIVVFVKIMIFHLDVACNIIWVPTSTNMDVTYICSNFLSTQYSFVIFHDYYYQWPILGADSQGSFDDSASPFCNNSIEILSGDRIKAMYPSRGGRLMTTPKSLSR